MPHRKTPLSRVTTCSVKEIGDRLEASHLYSAWATPITAATRPTAMNPSDRILLHQIHPAKLVTDACAAVLSLYFLWQGDLSLAVVAAMVPPLIASGLVLRFADLEALKQLAIGVYVQRHMTPAMQLLRVGGFLIMAVSAWMHAPLAILAGLLVVTAAWL